MKYNIAKYVLLFHTILYCFLASANEVNDLGVEKLSAGLRSLLQQEMILLETAMKEVIPANSEGDFEKISKIANQMKNSFILKQKLSKPQKHELHTLLPHDFIKKDQEFHYFADMLEHAAKKNKPELVVFYYSKLFESCSSCHKAHATHKFSNFIGTSEMNEHHH